MTNLAFVDTETTGLDPERHEVWEVGLILRRSLDDGPHHELEYVWQLPVDLGRADPAALKVGQFYARRGEPAAVSPLRDFADRFARLTHGAHMVGAVPSFDDAFLKRLLRANGACPGWHYHLIDVEALAAGCLRAKWHGYEDSPAEEFRELAMAGIPPWDSGDLSRGVGVNPDDFERHTALGDARWARAIYDAVVG